MHIQGLVSISVLQIIWQMPKLCLKLVLSSYSAYAKDTFSLLLVEHGIYTTHMFLNGAGYGSVWIEFIVAKLKIKN